MSDSEEEKRGVGHTSIIDENALASDDLQLGNILPRDIEERTACYDYTAEKQMSLTDSKLFYQRSQTKSKKSNGNHCGNPQNTQIDIAALQQELLSVTIDVREVKARLEILENMQSGSSIINAKYSVAFPTGMAEPSKDTESNTVHEPNVSIIVGDSVIENPQTIFPLKDKFTSDLNQQLDVPSQPECLGESCKLGGADARVQTTEETTTENPDIVSELTAIYVNVQKVLDLRRKYIRLSLQRDGDNPKDEPNWKIYPPPAEPVWYQESDCKSDCRSKQKFPANNGISTDFATHPQEPNTQNKNSSGKISVNSQPIKTQKSIKSDYKIGKEFDLANELPVPELSEMTFRLDDSGVFQVYENLRADELDEPVINIPTLRDFYMDLEEILNISSDGPSKSYAFRRLKYLEGKFNLYILLNEYQEMADTKRVPHRDFYNVRKVDTHVHHSACMNQKHLLRYIKSKMKKCPNEVVMFRDGKHLTLAEVFESINLTAYDLSIDTLDMHAHTDSFHRFDKFNLKYNPIGESRLRTIFLKTDNYIKGRYLAEITHEVISDLESSKYQMAEWRISIYGRDIDEWDKLAAWIIDNKIFSHNIRWLIQIPRLFDVYKSGELVKSFEEIIINLFQPLFEVTKDPSTHVKLHVFLKRVVGFDSVDDESKVERRLHKKFPVPKAWNSSQNPPYSYWIYYLFSNMASLNIFRKQRGFNTFVLRPHCGEAGDTDHLAAAVLCCHSISHGLLLRKVPLLQYVFYLEQIGVAMSPLSNNALFLKYERNPFLQYFKRGLNVSLSTDDPLQFAFTREPLIEEYSVAAQIYKLNAVDMCELAKNSVKQCGFEHIIKQHWLGPDYCVPGVRGNTVSKSNVPNIREGYRHETLLQELIMIGKYTAFAYSFSLPKEVKKDLGQEINHQTALPISDTNLKISSTTADSVLDLSTKTYQKIPPQLTRIPMSYMPSQFNSTQQQISKTYQAHIVGHNFASTSSITSPTSLVEDPTLSINFSHFSSNEPKIFPGVISRSSTTNISLGTRDFKETGEINISSISSANLEKLILKEQEQEGKKTDENRCFDGLDAPQ